MTESPNSACDGERPRTAWQRHVIDPIAAQLTQGITPEKIALTLAFGSAFALFPILGTTTILCLLVGILLRLNQPIIQIVNALCTPLHLPVIYAMVRLGNLIFHTPKSHVGIRMMEHMFWDDPKDFFEKFGITALHAIAAWAIIAPFWILIVYLFARPVLREVLRRKAVLEPGTVRVPPPEHPVP
ncbi:MAG TPA: DUF2062 domain-containing protein [Opitutaceae bacterium]|nr:DUF2062 domain-containing protein [Opitutaceae bacterium]